MGRPKKLLGEMVTIKLAVPADVYASIFAASKHAQKTVPDLIRDTLQAKYTRVSIGLFVESEPLEIHTRFNPDAMPPDTMTTPLIRKAKPPVTVTICKVCRKTFKADGSCGCKEMRVRKLSDGSEIVGPLTSDFSPENPKRAAAKKIIDEAFGFDGRG